MTKSEVKTMAITVLVAVVATLAVQKFVMPKIAAMTAKK